MQQEIKTQQQIDQEIVDFSFFLIQRGEAGHRRGAYLSEYGDSKGIRTIGYGTVTEAGYNHLGYREKTVSEDTAVVLAKKEMQHKLYEKCRTQFKDFDKLLPCYQALILDATYQGNWGQFVDELNRGEMARVFEIVGNNPNKERAAVRMRAVEMGMMVEQAFTQVPNANPNDVAKFLAEQLIQKYQHLNGQDTALTKDELALLYRSCMQAYGVDVTNEQVETFALSFPQVASGTHGIGHDEVTPTWTAQANYQMTSYQRGNGSMLYRQTPYPRPRKRLSDNYAPSTKQGRSVRIPYIDIPEPRFQDMGGVNYNTSYEAYNQKARTGGKKPDMIIIHSTEDRPGSSEHAALKYLASPNDRSVSAHIVITRDGTPYMLVPPERQANHAGESYWDGDHGLNDRSIGIEIVRATDEGYTREQAATAVAVVKQLSRDYNIQPDKVLGHDEISPHRKTDPGKDFDPIWDAMAKEGVALPASAHEDIKRQLGSNHQVHAMHLDPTLSTVSSSECAYLVPSKGGRGDMHPTAEDSDFKEFEDAGWKVMELTLDEEELKKKNKTQQAREEQLAQQAQAKEEEKAVAQAQSTEKVRAEKEAKDIESQPKKAEEDVLETKQQVETSVAKEETPSKSKKRSASKVKKSKGSSKKSEVAKASKDSDEQVEKQETTEEKTGESSSKTPHLEQKEEKPVADAKATLKKSGAENITEEKTSSEQVATQTGKEKD